MIYLSDNLPCEVRRIGIFELDGATPEPLEPFTYKMEVFGKEYEVEFDISRYEKPPQKPDKPENEIVEGSAEWDDLQDYKLYQAALTHNSKRFDSVNQFYIDISNYIIDNCVSPDDKKRIVTDEDWLKLYEAALVPQLTMDRIRQVLKKTYKASFDGEDIFDALEGVSKGKGEYDTIRLWENKLMIELKMTEVEYALLPIDERARKVCAMFLNDIISYLESEAMRKENGKS